MRNVAGKICGKKPTTGECWQTLPYLTDSFARRCAWFREETPAMAGRK